MNSNPHDSKTSASASSPAEETLRLLASLPAPAGLEERVHTALSAAPRRSRVLAWSRGRVFAGSSPIRPETSWMRSAAAAAIVFVVAGGGWGVYTRVEQTQPARVIVMPARMPVTGGFAGAGAMRPPQTLPGPKAPQPIQSGPVSSLTQPATSKKPASRLKAASKASPTHP
jgi:hypothetical protein